MNSATAQPDERSVRAMAERDAAATNVLPAAVWRALWLAWQAVRLPVFTFLVILEPVVRVLLSAIALLCVLMAFFFEYATALQNFPFWGMLGVGVGCILLLFVYYGLLRIFAR